MPICLQGYDPGHYLTLDLMVQHGGRRPAYTVMLDPSDPDGAPDLLNATGDLDFTRSTKAVGVTIYLKNKPTTHLRFDDRKHLVFSFAKDYGGTEYPITRTHYQIKNVQVDAAGQTVTFCYRNTRNDDRNARIQHIRSAYGIYLIDRFGRVGHIDPGVGNGSNK